MVLLVCFFEVDDDDPCEDVEEKDGSLTLLLEVGGCEVACLIADFLIAVFLANLIAAFLTVGFLIAAFLTACFLTEAFLIAAFLGLMTLVCLGRWGKFVKCRFDSR